MGMGYLTDFVQNAVTKLYRCVVKIKMKAKVGNGCGSIQARDYNIYIYILDTVSLAGLHSFLWKLLSGA